MSLKTPVAPKIYHSRSPHFPQFEFEWHESLGKVYVIEIPKEGLHARGVCIAEHCGTHGQFIGFVQTYLRGLRRGLDLAKENTDG